MKQSQKALAMLFALLMLLPFAMTAFAENLPAGYNWVPIPVSPEGLNEGEYYLDWSFLELELLLRQNDGYSEDTAQAAGMLAGAWYADHAARVVYGVYRFADENGVTQTREEAASPELYASVKQVKAHEWEPLPKSDNGLSKGDCFLNMQKLQTIIADEAMMNALNAATFFIDYENLAIRAEVPVNGTAYTAGNPVWLSALEEFGAQWLPVHFYIEGLNDGDWYMDFDEELAIMFEKGIEAPDGSFDGPHLRAMYERVGNANAFYVNANQNSRLFRYKTQTTATAYYPLMDLIYNNPVVSDYTARFDRTIRQYSPQEYHWTPIPTSADGLRKGECYLDFSYFADVNAYRPEHLDAAIAMYNAGEWLIDYDRMLLKGAIDIPPELYPTGEAYHMRYDPSAFLLPFALREAGAEWIPLPYGDEGLSEGDWYLDLDAFAELIGRGKSAAEKAEVRALIEQHVAFSYNPGGEQLVYKYAYTDLPGEDGVPVSGTVVLPLDLTLCSEDAFPYDYNALRQCVLQYHASADPDTEQQTDGDGGWFRTNVIGRLKSAISAILSFFRRLFNLMK